MPTSYIGASNVGPESSTGSDVRVDADVRSIPTTYIDASGGKPSPSTEVDNARPGAYIDAQPRELKPETEAYIEAYIGATTARLESSTGNSVHVDASSAESKPTIGNMYVIAEHGHTSRYTQETRYDDAVTSEFETGNTSRLQRRLPETREDNEQSSVMKDDTQSSMYGDTGLRHRK